MSLTLAQVQYLAREAAECHDKAMRQLDTGRISYTARREAAILMLNTFGYGYDSVKEKAYTEKDNVRTYVPTNNE